MAKNASKSVAKTDTQHQKLALEEKIRAEIESEPARKTERTERYKRMLHSGTAATFHVVNAAHTDKLADKALREHIAELIDTGRTDEMTIQLRAYAVKYLVFPIEIMRDRKE